VERPDDETIERMRLGDEAALAALFDRHLDRVYRFAYRMTGTREDAEEIAGETFLRAFRFAREYRGEGSFASWLFRIARNLCVERFRRRRSVPTVGIEDLGIDPEALESSGGLAVLGQLDGTALQIVVRDAFHALPVDYRVVLALRDVDELTNREAAHVIGKSPAATKSLHFRARRALRDALVEALGEEVP
jgi:RNA polymerase sigma-70 factor (ECF subfamily)